MFSLIYLNIRFLLFLSTCFFSLINLMLLRFVKRATIFDFQRIKIECSSSFISKKTFLVHFAFFLWKMLQTLRNCLLGSYVIHFIRYLCFDPSLFVSIVSLACKITKNNPSNEHNNSTDACPFEIDL